MSNLLLAYNNKSESFYHQAIKRLIFKYISNSNRNIAEKSLEKYINNRRADVYFRLKSGEKIVVEVQSSKISVKEIINRTEHYNNYSMHVLWILYGNGSCVASTKFPEDKRNAKISTVEYFLHKMYGGRVYYVNINFYKDKTTISAPFALHFSFPSKKKYRKIFQTKYEIYYIKNVNFTKISSWNLLCVNYNGFKLARFYDKNIKIVLKEKIIRFLKFNSDVYKSKKKLIKLIVNHFKQKYGRALIYRAVLELTQEKKVDLNHKIIHRIKKYFKIKKENFKFC
ncbi:MAG: competence protein CoiA family protein [Promethearchaeota archaeon]